MEMISWGFREEVGDLHIEAGGMIRGVEVLKAMGALITWEADSMSGMKFRMNKADKALVTPNSLQHQIFNIFSSSFKQIFVVLFSTDLHETFPNSDPFDSIF